MAWNEVVLDAVKQLNLQIGGTSEGRVFNASRRVLALAAGANLDSIFLTGTKPILLVTRTIGRTGSGVSATIFRDALYTGGTAAETYSNNDLILPTSTATLLTGVTLSSTGTQTVATAFGIGNTSNQGQGALVELGEPLLMKPNTAYLLRVTSLDTLAQDVSAFISWYEGGL